MIEKQREVSFAEFVVWELQQTGRHELTQSSDHRAKFLAAPPSFKHFHALVKTAVPCSVGAAGLVYTGAFLTTG